MAQVPERRGEPIPVGSFKEILFDVVVGSSGVDIQMYRGCIADS